MSNILRTLTTAMAFTGFAAAPMNALASGPSGSDACCESRGDQSRADCCCCGSAKLSGQPGQSAAGDSCCGCCGCCGGGSKA